MRRRRTVIILLLAVLSGTLAYYLAMRLLQERTRPLLATEPRAETSRVAVAARDLNIGDLVGEEDVRMIDWSGSAVPEGYARTVADVVGRGVLTPVSMNEPLLDTKLADRAAGGGLLIAIPEGMRAVSVRVDDVIAVAGFVRPHMRVDVLLTTTSGSDPITKIVLQNVTALAADKVYENDPQGNPVSYGVLTVLVTPEDAEKLTHATRQGTIQLALRNRLDLREIRTSGARVSQLLAGAGGVARGPVRARTVEGTGEPIGPTVVEIYKGGVRALKSFDTNRGGGSN